MRDENPTSMPARTVLDASRAMLQTQFHAIVTKPATVRLDNSSQTFEII